MYYIVHLDDGSVSMTEDLSVAKDYEGNDEVVVIDSSNHTTLAVDNMDQSEPIGLA